MRIALVSPYFRKTTGVGTYITELAKILSKENEVTIITGAWDRELEGKVRILKVPKLRGFRLLSGLIFTTFSYLRLLSSRFDIIHGEITSTLKHDVLVAHACFNYQFRLLLRASKNNWRAKLNLILNPRSLLVLLLEWANYKSHNYKMLIAVSPQVKRQLSQVYKIQDEEIVTIPNGINAQDFLLNRGRYRARFSIRSGLGISDEDVVIFFVGNDFAIKGLNYLLRALTLLPKSIKVLVAGSGNKSFSIEKGKAEASQLNLVDRVSFLGQVSNVADYYCSSDIFALLSLDDACPLSVLEAMSCGLPVAMSRGVGISEMFEDRKECLLIQNPADVRQVVFAFEYLLNRDVRFDMARKGQQKASEFSWERVGIQMQEIYSSINGRKLNQLHN